MNDWPTRRLHNVMDDEPAAEPDPGALVARRLDHYTTHGGRAYHGQIMESQAMTRSPDQTVADKRRVRDVIARAIYPQLPLVLDKLHSGSQKLAAIVTSDLASAGLLEATLDGLLAGTLVAQQGWQPIETAPKDGTHILMWSTREADDMLPQIIKWLDGQWVIGWDHTPAVRGGTIDEPTHWMPLPAALKETHE